MGLESTNNPRGRSAENEALPDITLPGTPSLLQSASFGSGTAQTRKQEPEKPEPADMLPAGAGLSGKLGRELVSEVLRLSPGEAVAGISSDTTRIATWGASRPNDRGGLDGNIAVYGLTDRDKQGNPARVSSQGFRCKFNVPPSVLPFSGVAKALVIEDGNPPGRLGIDERKRYATEIGVLGLVDDPEASRKHLLSAQSSGAYTTAIAVSKDEHSVFVKGKRLSSWVEGLRGFDGVEIVDRHSLLTPRWGADRLYSKAFRRDKDGDPRHCTALALLPQGDRLLAGSIGQVSVIALDKSKKVTKLPVSIPDGAEVSLLELDRAGAVLALTFIPKGAAANEACLRLYSLDRPGKLDRPTLEAELNLQERPRSISFNGDGSKLALSGESTTLFERSGARGLQPIGKADVAGARFGAAGRLVTHMDGFVVTFDLERKKTQPA